MMEAGFVIFGTTADVGVESWGRDLKEAFEKQAEGMFAVMVEAETVRARETFIISGEGDDDERLLASFLEELLFVFDAKRVFLKEFRIISIGGGKIRAEARGEEIDQSRHVVLTPIKAVTYHMLEVKKTDKGCKTRVVYDI